MTGRQVCPTSLAALLVLAPPAGAQRDSAATDDAGARTPPGTVWRTLADSGRAAWLRPAASLLIPGTGQLLGGQERAAVYFALEAAMVGRLIGLQGEARRERERYRELAFTVARAAFHPVVRDTAFEYFEQMQQFVESGPFDTDPGPALVPPTDPRTFNGSVWLLARETFFPDPDNPPPPDSEAYRRALQFYRERAVGPNFQWSWRNAGLEQDLFSQSIRQSDEAFRRASQQLGLLLANHLLSAVDAFVSHRLAASGRDVRIHAALGVPAAGERLFGFVMVRVGF